MSAPLVRLVITTNGCHVFVGDQELENVRRFSLNGQIDDLLTLTVEIAGVAVERESTASCPVCDRPVALVAGEAFIAAHDACAAALVRRTP